MSAKPAISPAANLQLAAVAAARCLLRLLRSGTAHVAADPTCEHTTAALDVALDEWLAAHAPGHEDIL